MSKKKKSVRAGNRAPALVDQKASLTAAQKKIDSQLLYAIKQRREGAAVKAGQPLSIALELDAEGRALLDINARVTPALLARIEQLGGKIISQFERYHSIRASVPLDQIEALAGSEEIMFIMPAARATTN